MNNFIIFNHKYFHFFDLTGHRFDAIFVTE